MFAILTVFVLALKVSVVCCCNFHTSRSTLLHPHLGRGPVKRAEGREVLDWDYSQVSHNWNAIQPDYATCHAGVSQSPINLHTASGLAKTHTPDFSGYTSSSHELSGSFFNWGFGPAFTIAHEGTDFTTLPALKFDDRTVYLTGWHIHTPSEHLVDGVKSRGEVHLVHVDESGEAASVVALRIEASHITSSAFFSTLPQTLIHFNDSTALDNVLFNPIAAIEEVGGVKEYWTYEGSLTTPPCSEGLRWFVPKQTLQLSVEQLTNLLGVSRFSSRAEQVILNQNVNV